MVRDVLDALAASGPVTNDTVLPLCRRWLKVTTDVVRSHELVTMYDDPVRVIEMPESRRGVAVAYCDPPGPLERTDPGGKGDDVPTLFAVSPAPADWDAAQVSSFYREYNRHMLLNLTVHEAMPGHVLQLDHSRRYRGNTDVRAALAQRHVHRGLGRAQRAADGRRRGRRPAARRRRRGRCGCSSSRCGCGAPSTRSSTCGCTPTG